MRFIHLLLAFAVGVSAAHFKRDPPSPLDGCISDLMNQTQTLANKVESLPSDIGAAAVILSAKPTIAFYIFRTGD